MDADENEDEPTSLSAQEVQKRLSFRFGPERTEWRGDEVGARLAMLGEWKLEILDGQLAGRDEQKLALLGLLIESLGLDKVLLLGEPESWRSAMAKAERAGSRSDTSR